MPGEPAQTGGGGVEDGGGEPEVGGDGVRGKENLKELKGGVLRHRGVQMGKG